jgi:hypothetical protein
MSAWSPLTKRPPLLEGRVKTIAATAPAAGDLPWWAQSAGLLAVLPGVVGLFVIFAVRIALRAVSSSRRQGIGRLFSLGGSSGRGGGSGAVRLLIAAGLGGMAGYRLGRGAKPAEYSLLLIASSRGDVPCRYPTAPSMLPVSTGDRVELLAGRLYPDNTARAWRCRNLSTGVSHQARIVATWVPFAAAISFFLCAYAVVSVLSLSG